MFALSTKEKMIFVPFETFPYINTHESRNSFRWGKKRERKQRASQCTILEFSLSMHNPGVWAAVEKKVVVTAKERRRASLSGGKREKNTKIHLGTLRCKCAICRI